MAAHSDGYLIQSRESEMILKLADSFGETPVIIASIDGWDSCGFFPSKAVGQENARRLMACWNAQVGRSTEDIEADARALNASAPMARPATAVPPTAHVVRTAPVLAAGEGEELSARSIHTGVVQAGAGIRRHTMR